jgi:hypothetical protein
MLKKNAVATLVEFVEIASEADMGRPVAPMQLFRFQGKDSASPNKVLVISGTLGPSGNDVHLSGLLQKAIGRGIFANHADVFVVPVLNPSVEAKGGSPLNPTGKTLRELSPDLTGNTPELETLDRWIRKIEPKAIIALGTGSNALATAGLLPHVVSRLCEVTEKPDAGSSESFISSFPGLKKYAEDHGLLWIEFLMEDTKKTFDEVREGEWKKSVGPALKWLLEADRFDPPKEEPLPIEHMIVPALELPSEFAHL